MKSYIEVLYKKTYEEETLSSFEDFSALRNYFKEMRFKRPLLDEEVISDLSKRCAVILKNDCYNCMETECAKELFPNMELSKELPYDKSYYDNVAQLYQLLKAMKVINKSTDIYFLYSEM